MGRCQLVRPEQVRVPLFDGEYIEVKKTLNAGEYRDLIAGMTAPSRLGEDARIDMSKVGMTKILQFLVGWSLVGFDEKTPIPYSPEMSEADRIATLRALNVQTFMAITEAIDAHEAQSERERTERKNVQAGERVSSAT
jgi:hypothetical protein